ncbi:hypothetical protein [Nocardia cyriacigeorgica]|uniref:hypothetical protein n=1 Tax=Nocardia cyriacigeorgica TaxID=135487 RepID=UPI0024577361|nr:hypothetical protein [Nocardia cyriacigeorgica]
MSILFHNTMRITDGHLEEFSAAVRRAVEFVEEHGPQLMVQVFLDEERGLAHSFQLYPDSEAVLAHWKLSDPYIQEVMAHCTVQSFETFGEMSEEVLAGLRSGPAGEPTIRPLLTGFTRF